MTAPSSSRAIERLTLPIEGLGCGGGGALTLERALAKLPGVARVYVNPATEMAYVEIDGARCSRGDITRVIECLGFRVEPPRRSW